MSEVLIRGGGDLATGTAVRLFRSGFRVVLLELPRPLAVRRAVAFAEAVYEGDWRVEDVAAKRVESMEQARQLIHSGIVPVLVAPHLAFSWLGAFDVLVDARLTKQPPETDKSAAPLVVGLGPGFLAGRDCHVVIETQRGPTLGRAYWEGSAVADTRKPEGDPRRVLRAPVDGVVVARAAIGQHVEAGQVIAVVGGVAVESPFGGMLRGLIRPGSYVSKGMKIGDVDSRDIRSLCFQISDKALAVGGGVLEAILSFGEIRDPMVRPASMPERKLASGN
jgi:xanthine dehydrogenase accessory factor